MYWRVLAGIAGFGGYLDGYQRGKQALAGISRHWRVWMGICRGRRVLVGIGGY